MKRWTVTLDFSANQNFVLTLTGNTTLTMPAATSAGNATRIFIIEDATNRATNLFTLSVLTTGQGTALPIPQGANMLLVSNGSTPATTLGGFLKKGVVSIVSSARTTYTAVAGDQIMVDTNTDIGALVSRPHLEKVKLWMQLVLMVLQLINVLLILMV